MEWEDPSSRSRPAPTRRPPRSRREFGGRRPGPDWRRIAPIALGLVAVLLVIWLVFIRDDDDGDDVAVAEKAVEVVSAAEVPSAVADAGYRVYWAGEQPTTDYEVTTITDGRTYVRYLPPGTQPEVDEPYLTVGSYLVEDAYDALADLDKRPGNKTFEVAGGGLALKSSDVETGLYVAFPDTDTEIEVFDPEPGAAEELVRSGALEPIE